MSNKSRKVAGIFASVAVGVGLLGGGVYAAYTDGATATDNVNVGKFACKVTAPAGPNVAQNGNSVTITNPGGIQSSASSNLETTASVTNTGDMPMTVHWDITHSVNVDHNGASLWQSVGAMGYAAGSGTNLMSNDITLAPGATNLTPYTIGFMWGELPNNDYLGQAFSVTYTATCKEVSTPQSKITFVGYATEAGHAALNLPAGSQPGDIAVVLEGGTASVATPTGYNNIATPVAPRNMTAYRMLVAGDTSVPAAATTVTDMEVAVYRGVAGVGSHTYTSGNSNGIGLSGGSPLYYPLKSIGLDGVSGPAMTKTDGSSWVVNMGFSSYASANMNLLSFNTIISSSPTPYVMGAADATNRSSNSSDAHVGLADTGNAGGTNGGVAAWATSAWTNPGYNFPLPGTSGVADHVIELLSQ